MVMPAISLPDFSLNLSILLDAVSADGCTKNKKAKVLCKTSAMTKILFLVHINLTLKLVIKVTDLMVTRNKMPHPMVNTVC